MSLKINNQYVDEAHSPIIEKALFADSVFVPGKTYTSKWQEIAGKIYVHKEVKGSVSAGAPGRDFSGTGTETALVEILADQNFMKERKIYQVQMNSIKFDTAASNYDLTAKEISEAREKVALAKMAMGSTVFQDATAITSTNIKTVFLNMRKTLRKNKARVDFAIVSPEVYSSILGDTSNYVPNHNDTMVATGAIGKYYGIPIYEANILDGVVTFNGDNKGFDLSSVDIIMGQNDGFAIFDNLVAARLIPADDFIGLRAQVEMNSGFKVVNEDKLLVKYNEYEVLESKIVLDDGTEYLSKSPYSLSVPTDSTVDSILFTLNKDAELVGSPQIEKYDGSSWAAYGDVTIEDGNILKVTPLAGQTSTGSTAYAEIKYRLPADSISSTGSDYQNDLIEATLEIYDPAA